MLQENQTELHGEKARLIQRLEERVGVLEKEISEKVSIHSFFFFQIKF